MRLYRLPLISGVALALVFYPFYFWWLAFVALVPLFYFALETGRSRKQLFVSGAYAGAIGIGPLVYFSLVHVIPLPHAPLFTAAVQLSSIPALALVATLFGLMSMGYALLHERMPHVGPLIAATLYGVLELALMWVFQGYYFGSLAHAVVALPVARSVAAAGGVVLVSFTVVFFNAWLAELVYKTQAKQWLAASLVVPALFCGMLAVGWWFSTEKTGDPGNVLAVAVMQPAPASVQELPYGTEEAGIFFAPELEQVLLAAAEGSDFVIYPFSPVEGIVYEGERPELSGVAQVVPDIAVGKWLERAMPASTTLMLWNTLAKEGELYDEFAFWRAGEKSVYQKQRLYLFSDYVPEWLRALGVARGPFDIAQGVSNKTVAVGEAEVSGLICSELHNRSLAPLEEERADILIAVGDDTFFPGSLVANFSLAAAQYYAARYHKPLLRNTVFGPSAIIDAEGAIVAKLNYGEQGILRGKIRFPQTRGQ